MKTFLSALFIVIALSFQSANAQGRDYQFTVSAGPGLSFGLDHLKKPGYTVKLYAEKFIGGDETKTYWLAFDYLQQSPEDAVTEPDAPGSPVLRTTHYHKARVMLLTFGARKFMQGGFLVGGGVGLGRFAQVYPTKTYSDGSRYYDQYKHEIGDLGIGHVVQAGYKVGKVQVLASASSIWLPFRAYPDVDYERATPSYLPTAALTVGYTF